MKFSLINYSRRRSGGNNLINVRSNWSGALYSLRLEIDANGEGNHYFSDGTALSHNTWGKGTYDEAVMAFTGAGNFYGSPRKTYTLQGKSYLILQGAIFEIVERDFDISISPLSYASTPQNRLYNRMTRAGVYCQIELIPIVIVYVNEEHQDFFLNTCNTMMQSGATSFGSILNLKEGGMNLFRGQIRKELDTPQTPWRAARKILKMLKKDAESEFNNIDWSSGTGGAYMTRGMTTYERTRAYGDEDDIKVMNKTEELLLEHYFTKTR